MLARIECSVKCSRQNIIRVLVAGHVSGVGHSDSEKKHPVLGFLFLEICQTQEREYRVEFVEVLQQVELNLCMRRKLRYVADQPPLIVGRVQSSARDHCMPLENTNERNRTSELLLLMVFRSQCKLVVFGCQRSSRYYDIGLQTEHMSRRCQHSTLHRHSLHTITALSIDG